MVATRYDVHQQELAMMCKCFAFLVSNWLHEEIADLVSSYYYHCFLLVWWIWSRVVWYLTRSKLLYKCRPLPTICSTGWTCTHGSLLLLMWVKTSCLLCWLTLLISRTDCCPTGNGVTWDRFFPFSSPMNEKSVAILLSITRNISIK